MINLFKRKTAVPVAPAAPNEPAYQPITLWEVRWTSRHGQFHHDVRGELEAFASKEEADDFANDLRQAFKLIRYTAGDKITVQRNGVRHQNQNLIKVD